MSDPYNRTGKKEQMAYKTRHYCAAQQITPTCTTKHRSVEAAESCKALASPVRVADVFTIQEAIGRWSALFRSEGNTDEAIKRYWIKIISQGMNTR